MEMQADINATIPVIEKAPAKVVPATKGYPRTTLAGKLILTSFGLVLFAAMGWLLGNIIVDMHIKVPFWPR
jgi:hypothetical protein